MSPTENYAMTLAITSILIEKGVCTREYFNSKKNNIADKLVRYNKIMLSDFDSNDIEMKKMKEVEDILKSMAEECHFDFNSDDIEINNKLRDNILKNKAAASESAHVE